MEKKTMIRTIITDFLQFLVKPNTNEIDLGKNAVLKKIIAIILFVPISFILALFFQVSFNLALNKLGVPVPDGIVTGVSNARKTFGPTRLFFQIAILAPIIEEASFRLPMKFNKLLIPLSIFVMYVMMKLLSISTFYTGGYSWQYITMQIGIGLALFSVFYALLRIKTIGNFIEEQLYKKHFGLLFYGLSCWFAFIHFYGDGFSWYMFATTAPQLIIGIFYGYSRIKFGFQYAVLMHFFINLYPALS